MGYTYDFFVGQFKCQTCGEISPGDSSTNNQTKICSNTDHAEYGIGAILKIDTENLCESGYICRIIPVDPSSFSLLTYWECPTCAAPYNWLAIKIENSIIIDMQTIMLNEKTINSLDLVTDDCVDFGWQLNGDKFINVGPNL